MHFLVFARIVQKVPEHNKVDHSKL